MFIQTYYRANLEQDTFPMQSSVNEWLCPTFFSFNNALVYCNTVLKIMHVL